MHYSREYSKQPIKGAAMITTDTSREAAPVKCRRCKRPLTASAAFGIGPRCAAIEAAMEGLKPAQVDKAMELLADGGVIKTAKKGVRRTVSSKGGRAYLTTARSCTCPYGLKVMGDAEGKHCYHVGIVRLVLRPALAKAA